MAKFTPKTANDIYYALTKQIIETANNAISIFLKRPSTSNLMHVEDTLIDLIPFTELALDHIGGKQIFRAVIENLKNVQELGTANLINENEILSYFETEA